MTHDSGEMQDYSDDIDTMLVFVRILVESLIILNCAHHYGADPQAGLFSAILTAFLVQTYPMLQADSTATTNQLLAISVSTQLRAAGTIITDTLNKTLTSLADAASSSFSPSTATRWINILFFLSLVFSLAAALFSILAKQWIREYIKWNSPLALPRENVLVRQIRIEAWEDWQVSMILSSIPILLELGMILFLAGVILLLWTLDDIVAIVVTIFVSLFLGTFAAFTVLPIFSKRCPYRSPTAWACLAIASTTKMPLKYISLFPAFLLLFVQTLAANIASLGHRRRVWDFRKCAEFWEDWISVIQSPSFTSWRVLDLESIRITKIRAGGWWTKPTDLHATAQRELCREVVNLKESGEFAEHPHDYYISEDTIKALLLDIAETSHLIRALSWVQQSSQSTRVAEYIDQCAAEIHPNLPPPAADEADWHNASRMVTNWCILWTATDTSHGAPYLAMLLDSHGAEPHAGISRAIALRQRSRVYYEKNNIYLGRIMAMPIEYPHEAAVLARILIYELQYFGASLPSGSTHSLLSQRRFLELLSTLLSLSEYGIRPFTLSETLEKQLLGASHQGVVDLDMSRAWLRYISTLFETAKVQRLEHQSGLGKIRWTSQR